MNIRSIVPSLPPWFQSLILIYRRGNFMYHHWGCTSIYWPLSYPFRSLATNNVYNLRINGCVPCLGRSSKPWSLSRSTSSTSSWIRLVTKISWLQYMICVCDCRVEYWRVKCRLLCWNNIMNYYLQQVYG